MIVPRLLVPNWPFAAPTSKVLVSMANHWQLLVAILAVHSPLDFSKIAKEMGQGEYIHEGYPPNLSRPQSPANSLHETLCPTRSSYELV